MKMCITPNISTSMIITFSNNLSWSNHTNKTTIKASNTLNFFRNLDYCLKQAKQVAYFAFLRSTLEYGSAIWDHLQKDKTNLE